MSQHRRAGLEGGGRRAEPQAGWEGGRGKHRGILRPPPLPGILPLPPLPGILRLLPLPGILPLLPLPLPPCPAACVCWEGWQQGGQSRSGGAQVAGLGQGRAGRGGSFTRGV